jgi:hypothetical protein
VGTGETPGGLGAGGGGLGVAAHGDPMLTGGMGWAAKVGGARHKLGR